MTLTSWFLAVDIVHDMPGRLRLRYRRRPKAPDDREALEYAVGRIPGVRASGSIRAPDRWS